MSEPHVLVQNAYAAFGRGDIPGLLSFLAPDIEWRFLGDRRAPYTGRVQGHAGVAEFFGKVAQADGIQLFEPREFLVGPDHVTVVGFERTQALPAGRVFECEWIHIWKIRDGLLAEFLGLLDTEAAGAARA